MLYFIQQERQQGAVTSCVNAKGGIIMNNVMKCVLIILVVIYVISPIDFVPGPVDDFIVILLGLASQKKLENKQ